AFTDVSHLDQAIGELDSLARFRSPRPVFLRHHSATAARTDHDWLFWAQRHGRSAATNSSESCTLADPVTAIPNHLNRSAAIRARSTPPGCRCRAAYPRSWAATRR